MAFLNTELPQGTLDLLILKIVDLGAVHGYGIAQRLEAASGARVRVPQGSLYPALHRLESRGMLAAQWRAAESGREAKFYELTEAGRGRLKAETEGWMRLNEAIGLVLALEKGVGL